MSDSLRAHDLTKISESKRTTISSLEDSLLDEARDATTEGASAHAREVVVIVDDGAEDIDLLVGELRQLTSRACEPVPTLLDVVDEPIRVQSSESTANTKRGHRMQLAELLDTQRCLRVVEAVEDLVLELVSGDRVAGHVISFGTGVVHRAYSIPNSVGMSMGDAKTWKES